MSQRKVFALAALILAALALTPNIARTTTASALVDRSPRTSATVQQSALKTPLRGIHGRVLPQGGSLASTLGGTPISLTAPPMGMHLNLGAGTYRLSINDTGTGWQEPFVLKVPRHRSPEARPLMVVFHGYGNSELSVPALTSYFDEAEARGWYAVAPLGAHKYNYSIDYAQQNVQAVLDWVMDTFNVDETRVYGVGFSMGGGCVTNYAALHQDPSHAVFAAVANHTGTVSVDDVYERAVDTSILDSSLMFGGTPSQFPFKYERASTISYDATTQAVDGTHDLARNLVGTPLITMHAQQDPLQNIVQQSNQMHDWVVNTLGGASTLVEDPSATEHSWTTFDETWVCDQLAQHSLSLPTDGTHRLLADRDGAWQHFDIKQDAAGAWTPFRWTVDNTNNLFALDQTENLESITVDTQAVNIDTSSNVLVMFGGQDGTQDTVILKGYDTAPTNVLRNGVATASWSWDAQTQTLSLTETDPSVYPLWTIQR